MAQRISRRELKQDEFVEAAVDLSHWLETHRGQVLKWAGGVLMLVLAGLGWLAYAQRNQARASEILGEGLRRYGQALEAPQPDAGALTEALGNFDEAAQRGGGSTATVARFYRAAVLLRLGRSDEATELLEQLRGGKLPETLGATVTGLLVRAYTLAERSDDAIALLSEEADRSTPTLPADEVLLELGRLQLGAGRNDEAERTWKRLVETFPQSPAAAEARRLIGS